MTAYVVGFLPPMGKTWNAFPPLAPGSDLEATPTFGESISGCKPLSSPHSESQINKLKNKQINR